MPISRHHRVRPRRALLPPLVCSRPDDPRDDGIGPTSTPRSCLENHADGPPSRPTRRGRVASSHARRFPRRRRLPRDRRRAAPPAGLGWGANAPARTTRRHAPPPRWTSISPPSRSAPRDARSASTETLPFPPPTRAARAYHAPPRRTTAEYDTCRRLFARVFRSSEGENTRARATSSSMPSIDAVLVRVREHAPRRVRTRARHFACAMSSRTPSLDSSSNPRLTAAYDRGRTSADTPGLDGLGFARCAPTGSATRW